MPTNDKPAERFAISLRENGLHSLWRGMESYGTYTRTQDKLTLKDAIMHLHHGVELLMKEVLTRYSPFLIFEDLRDAATKQKQADESGVGIFFLRNPPKTVTYEEAIKRVSAFVKPPELTRNLQADLSTLNQFRNQLEHYAIEADREALVRLLAALREPLLELFDHQLGGVRDHQPAKVKQVWNEVKTSAAMLSGMEREVFDLAAHFKGQRVPGRLLNAEGEFTLPIFTDILPCHSIELRGTVLDVDILGEGQDFRWVVEVKGMLGDDHDILAKMRHVGYALNAQTWLVAFTNLSEGLRVTAHEYGILATGAEEWKELKQLVLTDNNGSSNQH